MCFYDTYRFLSFGLVTNTGQETHRRFHSCSSTVGFEERGLVLRTRGTSSLSICGDINRVGQTTGVCILDEQSTTLIVSRRNKAKINPSDPEPHDIVEVIAAY
jgi:hypothetical protein